MPLAEPRGCPEYTRMIAAPIGAAPAPWSFECHYCGFDAKDDMPPAYCPKCGGTAWELIPSTRELMRRATQSEAAVDDDCGAIVRDLRARATVLFRLRYQAAHVYLLLGLGDQRGHVIPMQRIDGDEWELRLRLPPHVYHYRFYIDDGTHLFYFSPADVTGHRSGPFDGRVLVPPVAVPAGDADAEDAVTA